MVNYSKVNKFCW